MWASEFRKKVVWVWSQYTLLLRVGKCQVLNHLTACVDYIKERVKNKGTHKEIASDLQQLFPNSRGLSERSVRRFCSLKGIHYASRLSAPEVNEVVESAVSQVSSCYN